MKRLFPLLFILALSASCANLPQIMPDTRCAPDAAMALSTVFPSGRWQLTHAMDAIVPGGKKSGLIGVSVLSSADRSIACALMSLEGFVIFSGRYDGRLTVDRALPPFNRPGFAKGLIDDLMMLFFKPDGPMQKTGMLPDGAGVYRFGASGGGTTDIILRDDHAWSVQKYSSRHQLERSVEARDRGVTGAGDGIALTQHLTLKRHGFMGYQLDLRLVDAIRLP
jgi:hypothetical protein